jgi:hypothetical protein
MCLSIPGHVNRSMSTSHVAVLLVCATLLAGCAGNSTSSTTASSKTASASPTATASSQPTQSPTTSAATSTSPQPTSSTTTTTTSTAPAANLTAGNETLASAPGPTLWFLHDDGCDDNIKGATMDFNHTSGEFDGCGSVVDPLLGKSGSPATGQDLGGQGSLGSTDGSLRHYTTVEHSRALASGATLNGTIYLLFWNPGSVTVSVSLLQDGTSVAASADVTKTVTGAPVGSVQGTPVPGTGYVAFDFSATTSAAIAPTGQLELALFVSGVPAAFVGYDGEHISRFTL